MLSSIIRYLRGYLKIRITGYSPERFLNACSYRRIYLWRLKPVGGAYEMYIKAGDFAKLKPIIKKTGTKAAITGRFGLPFFLHRYRNRKLFFTGAFLCAFSIYLMSLFIWEIDIRGNSSYTDDSLLSYLAGKKVVCGMRKSSVDCGSIVKNIRKAYPDIIWVCAYTKGSRLLIEVKENEEALKISEKEERKGSGTDILADRDCVITEIVTRRGNPLVHVGDQVKKGDLLVSGRLDILDDNQEVSAYRYQRSDARIRGRTVIGYEDSISLSYQRKEYLGVKKEEEFLKIGEYILSVGSTQNNYRKYEEFSSESQLKLGKRFFLPIFYGKRTARPYISREEAYQEKDIQRILSARFLAYKRKLQKKGVEILENDVKIYKGSVLASARGSLTVIMNIGRERGTKKLPLPKDLEKR